MAIKQLDKIVAKKFWAVQLSDSEHRKWSEQAELGKLTFQWDDIPVSDSDRLININIAVAKAYREYDKEKIKQIAKGIYDFSRIEKGEGILGINGDRLIEKVGIVTSEFKFGYSKRIELNINWVKEFKPDFAKSSVFNRNMEIQRVTQDIIKNTSLPIEISTRKNKEEISALDTIFLKQIEEKEKITAARTDGSKDIHLFFGTNRNKTESGDYNRYYGSDLSEELRCGLCTVSVPLNHVQGLMERPNLTTLYRERPQWHIILNSIEEIEIGLLMTTLANRVEDSPTKSALVFIHGFNVSFAEAARRTAQIAHDVPFNGISGFFSWPSAGSPIQYTYDLRKARASSDLFEKFIDALISNTGIQQLHIIAHSMGNVVLTTTLKDISDKASWADKIRLINQIILAAPDIDQDEFNRTILPYFKNVGVRRTLYSSDRDIPMLLSEATWGGPKIGQGGADVYVQEGLDTVDASNLPPQGEGDHGYIFKVDSILSDMFYLLGHNLDPISRRLKNAKDKNGRDYWLFPVKAI